MGDVVNGFASSGLMKGLQKPGGAQATPFFMSAQHAELQQWRYNGGQVISGVGVSGGQIFVGFAYGPSNSLLNEAMFLSLSPL
jgi:hypothetical protein